MSDEIHLLQSLLSVQRQHLRQYEKHTAALQLPYVAAALRGWRREIARLEAHLNALQRGVSQQVNEPWSSSWYYVLGFHWQYEAGVLAGPFCAVCYGVVDWGRVTLRHALFDEWSELQGQLCCRVLSCRTATTVPRGIMVNRAMLDEADLNMLGNRALEVMAAAFRQEALHEIMAIIRQHRASLPDPVLSK